MELEVAIHLIKTGISNDQTPQTWVDLGAGNGLFTKALSQLLSSGSSITAIDRDESALNKITLSRKDVSLNTSVMDFVKDRFTLPVLDGVLMANALHFSPDKAFLLKKLKEILSPSGRIILIEYDTDTANPWVPFPVSMTTLQSLAHSCGFTSVKKLEETPSVYNRAMIYSALLR